MSDKRTYENKEVSLATMPTDPRYQRLQQAIADIEALLSHRHTAAMLQEVTDMAYDTWQRCHPSMLDAARRGEPTEAWAEAFERLRELSGQAARMKQT